MMAQLPPFVLSTLILASVLFALIALKLLRFPTIPAYFIAGVVAGPDGLGILYTGEAADFAAELGIILLLFTIGLKFDLNALRSIRYFVFFLGGMQVAVTALLFTLAAAFFVDNLLLASLIGFVAAMSSTAIVSQLLIEDNAVVSPVGRRALGMLLLQDLIVIPLIIIYSTGATEESLFSTTALLALKITLVLVFVVIAGPRLMRGWLNLAVRYGDKELFIVNIITIIVVFSMLTGVFGLSHVLGAFLAGILIAETFHRHRVEQLIEPFRQLLLGFFFISLGILIHPQQMMDEIGLILLLAAAVLLLKIPVVFACTRIAKAHSATAWRAALLIGGTGEFGFVLLAVANDSGILSRELFQLLVPANMLALIAVPFFWMKSDAIIRRLCRDDWSKSALKMTENLDKTKRSKSHVIICGFGRTGQAIAGILRAIPVEYVVLEDDHTILEAVGEAENVLYGNGERDESLLSAGILRAKVLLISFFDPVTSALAVQTAKRLNPGIYIIAKATTSHYAKTLSDAGANEVLIESHESGFSLAGQCLRQVGGIPARLIEEQIGTARKRQNLFFLGQYTGTAPEEDDNARQMRLIGVKIYSIPADFSLSDLKHEVTLVAWRRQEQELDINDKSAELRVEDELVLLGAEKTLQGIKQQLIGSGAGTDKQDNPSH